MILVVRTRSNSKCIAVSGKQYDITHCLLSLVFMGSEKYPFKGIIDQLANRGFSNGTNAWTDTDHTAYTVSTAGEQGFLQILPIYVDHILYPTLTQSGFVTEVKPSSFRAVSALPHSSTLGASY
jgi:Zn-dependent M16 (insulinase) family peptidase